MSQWTSVCTHAHTDYGLASTIKIVSYAVGGKPLRPCVHYAMVPKHSIGSPNVSKLRNLADKHPQAFYLKIYDTESEKCMRYNVAEIVKEVGDSGVNLIYTCPDWCEESTSSGLENITEAVLRRTFHQNCVIPVFLTRLFYDALKQAAFVNKDQVLNRRRAAVVHMIGEHGVLGDHFSHTRGMMYGYSASLAAMIMSMKTMAHDMQKREEGILVLGVISPSPHTTPHYDVSDVMSKISDVVHGATAEEHGKCIHYTGKHVSY